MLASMLRIYRSRYYCNISTEIDPPAVLHSCHELDMCPYRCKRVSSDWFVVVYDIPFHSYGPCLGIDVSDDAKVG